MLLLLVVLMGKNTMIRKAIRGHLEQKPELEKCGEFLLSLFLFQLNFVQTTGTTFSCIFIVYFYDSSHHTFLWFAVE